jgi:hypothetical protein
MGQRRTVLVEVTQQDIDEGNPCLGHACPVFLAIRRAVPGSHLIHVGYADAFFTSFNSPLPGATRDFIRTLTTRPNARVVPFSFPLEVESEAA